MAPSKKAGKKSAAAPSKAGAASNGGKVAKADWKEGFKKKQAGVSDMTLLSTISNESINENLKKRFENKEIYTYIAHVLISVNPFRDLGIYTLPTLQSYKGKNRLEMPPHVFAIAESAYYAMNAYGENQCVIISGESGAGKTEAAKRIMQYIAEVSGESEVPTGGAAGGIGKIKDMVLATNPLLESFGCAKTLRNDNSSRHGKYLEIMFNGRGEPVGAQITNYLLEKSRVTKQIKNERDFHIFYQFTKSASAEMREMFGIQGPEAYVLTSQSGCLDVPSIDDVADFNETLKAMGIVGLSGDEQENIFRCISIILWLGNVKFVENAEGNSMIPDESVIEFIAYLMEVDKDTLSKVLCSRVVETQRGGRRGSIYDVPLNVPQASSGRDALSQAIYANLFEWIVERVNVSMKPKTKSEHVLGVLDIYGFEIFQDNNFEQLCINYVNEKLQQIFIELTLKAEQEEYVREQIKWTPIDYFNNKVVCELIEEKRPPGIFAALNDAVATAHADPAAADNSFVQRLGGLTSNQHFETRGSKFLIKHYAGEVLYNVSGMTEKNKDSLVKDLTDLVSTTGNGFLKNLFPDRIDAGSKKRPPTAGDRIKASANALVDNLMKAQPSYIRTIKPNQNRSPTEYDSKAILHQVKYLGLQENIRVRRAGFAYRNTFEKMVERFYLLSPNTSYAGEYTWQGDPQTGCAQILKDTGIAKDEWQMGVTKAFIKNPETLFALETMRDRYWHNMAARIQRAWRNFLRYRNECASRIQRFWRGRKDAFEYARVRQRGHELLAERKERRRYSLVSQRRFAGDYLDVGGKSSSGAMLRQAAGLSGSESVIFSGRIELLKSSFGRSSKPSPRFLVVTNSAAYFLISAAKDGRIATTIDRKIPLVTIRSVGLSNLRDDWITFNASSSEEGDPVFTSVFKTELITHLHKATNGSIQINIGSTIGYNKKKDKKAEIQFRKDESITRFDVYKSSVVSVSSGEPPNSVSKPAAKRKPGIVRPITSGKLLKRGGPSNPHPSAGRIVPKAQVLPGKSAATPSSGMSYPTSHSVASKPAVATSGGVNRGTPAPAPPSRPVAAKPENPKYKALYAFAGQEGEVDLVKGDVVEVKEKDPNGWWLIVKNGTEGWAPSNYLELMAPPKPAPPPPPPPARRAPPAAPKPEFDGSNGGPKVSLTGSSSIRSSPASSRPGSAAGFKPADGSAPGLKPKPPVLAAKPVGLGGKPPVMAPKPGAASGVGIPLGKPLGTGGRPAVPKAPIAIGARPTPGGGGGGGGGGTGIKLSQLGGGAPKAGGGIAQMDLAAALRKRSGKDIEE
ncbi:microfilament motor [Phaffia rhodozyma]|uniref:Microfilament motor n=1 Tax=Phaffia rhodozyma TaxID=264483 RepID=A0A0F7SNJ1_PHARH|nr:microfilament motor [Phaffia rhodozyma]